MPGQQKADAAEKQRQMQQVPEPQQAIVEGEFGGAAHGLEIVVKQLAHVRQAPVRAARQGVQQPALREPRSGVRWLSLRRSPRQLSRER